MKKMISAMAACAALAMPAMALADTAMDGHGAMGDHDAMTAKATAATMLCRPAGASEKPTAMLIDGKTPIVCKKMDGAMMLHGKGGPDLSKARSAEQADAAWRAYVTTMIALPGGDGGG